HISDEFLDQECLPQIQQERYICPQYTRCGQERSPYKVFPISSAASKTAEEMGKTLQSDRSCPQ
ncbi:MAG: hypothetical protein AAFQ23_09915, partial [Cyanobacteria bacterium J06623_1]